MSKQMRKMLTIVGIVLIILLTWYGGKKLLFLWFMGHFKMPAVTISTSTATNKNWQSYLTSVGTLTAVNGVEISSEVPGIIKDIKFTSGQFVSQGSVLVLLDTSVEEAQLKNSQAQLKLAQINYERDLTLLKKNALSQASLDTTLARLQQAESSVQETQAKIKQKTITAPFSGKIGIRKIDIGDYVSPGAEMVSLQTMDPLFVEFNLPEQYISEIYLNQPIDININNETKSPIRGEITAINSKVDQSTRNILIQATLPNKNMSLYPGMFADVKIWLRKKSNVIILPQTSISYSLHGDSVFIIKEDKNDKSLHAYRQYVTVGDRRESEVSITKGIKAGDQVVTSGQLKLQNGTTVVIDNSVILD